MPETTISEQIASELKSEKYADLDLTNFPVSEDNWPRMTDISISLLQAEQNYQALWESGDVAGANALLDNNEGLRNAIFNADKWNKIRDGLIALQRFFLEDIQNYIEGITQSTIGINDNPTSEEKPLSSYSVAKIDSLLNGITNARDIILTTDGWVGNTAPFTQSITVTGLKSTDKPIIGLRLDTTDSGNSKLIEKSWGFVYTAITADNSITFYARKKPTVNIPLSVKGK